MGATGYAFLKYEQLNLTKVSEHRFEDRTFALKPANLSISGILVDANDMPVAGRAIHLAGPRGNDEQPRRMTVTNEKGEFYVGRVCRGPLRIQAGYSSDPGDIGYLDAHGGDKNVKVVVGQKGVHAKHVSLEGKPLPNLTEFKVCLLPDDANNMKLLVCFFDIGQRPSRHFVRELAKKAEQLDEKGITIVTVQASRVDKGKLDKWVEDNNIGFAVGMIEGEEEERRFKWGVTRLPWLILTDKEHVVRAEGFGLGEVDEKIGAISQK